MGNAEDLEREMIPEQPQKTGRFDKHFRAWFEWVLAMAIGALFVALAIGGSMVQDVQNVLDSIVDDREVGREVSFKTRAVACQILILDNDRDFAIADECAQPEVIRYYPPRVCEYFQNPPHCSDDFVPSQFEDPALERTR